MSRYSLFAAALLNSLLCISAGQLAYADEAPPNTLTDAEKQAGWKLLFDGKTTDGWRNYKKKDVGPGWKIVDSTLSREGNGAGDIITNDQFGSYELLVDYKISPGGNSGIMYAVTEDEDTPWKTGPEIQIQDNKEGHDPQLSGWLYQMYKPDTDATKPAGQWNTVRFVYTPAKAEVYMNGVKYYEFVPNSDDWKKHWPKANSPH